MMAKIAVSLSMGMIIREFQDSITRQNHHVQIARDTGYNYKAS